MTPSYCQHCSEVLTRVTLFGPVPKAMPWRACGGGDVVGIRCDQVVPFQRAIRLAGTPPAAVNTPPTTRSPFCITARDSA